MPGGRIPPAHRTRPYVMPVRALTTLIEEVERAMTAAPKRRGCFVCNEAMEALRRHGPELLPVVEYVVRRYQGARYPYESSNVGHLLMVYFDRAADLGADSSAFVRSLDGPALQQAFHAIFQIWGPHNPARRRTIHPALLRAWQERRPESFRFSWREDVLSRAVADGRLLITAARPV